jgi:hypothetical protein
MVGAGFEPLLRHTRAAGLAGEPCYRSGRSLQAGRSWEEDRPMIWIIIALIFAAAAAAGFRIQALTRDEPPEPPLAHRWRALGGGSPPSS